MLNIVKINLQTKYCASNAYLASPSNNYFKPKKMQHRIENISKFDIDYNFISTRLQNPYKINST